MTKEEAKTEFIRRFYADEPFEDLIPLIQDWKSIGSELFDYNPESEIDFILKQKYIARKDKK